MDEDEHLAPLYRRDLDEPRDGSHKHARHGSCGHEESVAGNAKRDVQMDGAPGYIDVTSPMFNSTTAQRIASLVLSTSNGTDSNSTFVLNASNNIRTQVYLVPIAASNETSSSTTDGSPIAVNLKVPIFVPTSATVEPYCATFDPAPSAPAPMSVMPCMLEKVAHSSQTFLYYADTGVIHPDWQPAPASQSVLDTMSDSVDDSVDSMGMDPQMNIDEVMSESATSMPLGTGSASIRSMSAAASMTGSMSDNASATETASMSMTSTIPDLPTMMPTMTASSSMGAQAAGMTSSSAPSASSSMTASASASASGPASAPPASGSPNNVTLVFTPANPSAQSDFASTSAETSSFENSEPTQENFGTKSARDDEGMMMDDSDMTAAGITETSASSCTPSSQPSRYPVTPGQSSYEPVASPASVAADSYNGPDVSDQDDSAQPQGQSDFNSTSTGGPDYTAPYV